MNVSLVHEIAPSGLISIVLVDPVTNTDLSYIQKNAYMWYHLTPEEITTLNSVIDTSDTFKCVESISSNLALYKTAALERTKGVFTCPCCGQAISIINDMGYCVNIQCSGWDVQQAIYEKLLVLFPDMPYLDLTELTSLTQNCQPNDAPSIDLGSILLSLKNQSDRYGIDKDFIRMSLLNTNLGTILRLAKIPDPIEEELSDFVLSIPSGLSIMDFLTPEIFISAMPMTSDIIKYHVINVMMVNLAFIHSFNVISKLDSLTFYTPDL